MHYMLNEKEISTCAIGTWAWGTGTNGAKIVFGAERDEERLEETFNTALDLGFDLWDTAEVYGAGSSEQLIAKFRGERELILSTKHYPQKKYKPGECRKAIEGSLERLGVDSIDLYWLHAPKNIEQNMKELAECKKEGLIQSIGLSNGNETQIRLADIVLRENGTYLAAVQNHYSLLAMERESRMLDYCLKHDILFFGYMILEQGALSGHYDAEHHFPTLSTRGMSFGKGKFRKITPLIELIRSLGEKYNVDPSQIAAAWAISKGVIPIVGLTKPNHAVSLAQGMNIELSAEDIASLEQLALDSGVKCKGFWE